MNAAVRTTLMLSLGGMLGANARFWLGRWIQSQTSSEFPWGTFAINLSGAFALGLLFEILRELGENSEDLRVFFAVGFLGSYTTFSTLVFDTTVFASKGEIGKAILDSFGSITLGVFAVVAGMFVGRFVAP